MRRLERFVPGLVLALSVLAASPSDTPCSTQNTRSRSSSAATSSPSVLTSRTSTASGQRAYLSIASARSCSLV